MKSKTKRATLLKKLKSQTRKMLSRKMKLPSLFKKTKGKGKKRISKSKKLTKMTTRHNNKMRNRHNRTKKQRGGSNLLNALHHSSIHNIPKIPMVQIENINIPYDTMQPTHIAEPTFVTNASNHML